MHPPDQLESGLLTLESVVAGLGAYPLPQTAIITLGASAYCLFRREEDHEFEQKLWRHSLAVGIGVRLVARRVGSRQEPRPPEASTLP